MRAESSGERLGCPVRGDVALASRPELKEERSYREIGRGRGELMSCWRSELAASEEGLQGCCRIAGGGGDEGQREKRGRYEAKMPAKARARARADRKEKQKKTSVA